MSISKTEAKQLLERLIFEEESPQDWVQDVWGLSPVLGDSAAKLLDAFYMLIDCSSPEKLDSLLQSLYAESLENEQ
jgi:predicted 3-demethylubiquinone-9 3-methyltransferase (glyoxalase superfamily)